MQAKLLGMGSVTIMVLVGISRPAVGPTSAREEELPSRLVEILGVMASYWVALLEMLLMLAGWWGSQLKRSATSGTLITLANLRFDTTSQLPGLLLWHLENILFLVCLV